jgi:hypothetical protein
MVFSNSLFFFCFTLGTVEVFPFQVSVDRADGKGRRNGEVRQPVVFGNALHQVPAGLPVFDGFPRKAVEDGPTGILGLQNVLVVQSVERYPGCSPQGAGWSWCSRPRRDPQVMMSG